jgi:hypothetical protein
MYAAFGAQFAASVALDRLGVYGGNLQVRLFPTFMLVAVALASPRLIAVWKVARASRLRRPARIAAAVLAIWLVVAGLLKATNEPLLSNVWIFYSPQEASAIAWSDGHIRDADVWIGPHDRLREYFLSRYGLASTSGNRYRSGTASPTVPNVLASSIIRGAVSRYSRPMPELDSRNLVYDNGDAAFYRRRPLTPFER